MQQKRVALKTLGCKTNHYETDAIRQQFAGAGFYLVDFHESADIYIVNTCTVTGEAERKTRQLLRRAKERNKEALLVAIGCSVEVNSIEKLADICIGTRDKSKTFAIVCQALEDGETLQIAGDPEYAYGEYGSVVNQSETRAQIKIEDGCDNFCTYCIIPYARGPVRSRNKDKIVEEAKALALAGFREIVLTGIHVCSYGAEWGWPSHAVMELADELAGIESIRRIRLGSLEPRSLTDEFIRLAGRNPKLCPHFHMSLQSGSDAVLRQMERDYDTKFFRQVADKLRLAFDDPGITTDIIVGFPGETESQHQESLAFCRELAFSRMHVFRYSPRRGTKAASRSDHVDAGTISRRGREMGRLAQVVMRQFHEKQINKKHLVILESIADGHYCGYTEKYVPVRLPVRAGLSAGDLVMTEGTAVREDFLLCDNAFLVNP